MEYPSGWVEGAFLELLRYHVARRGITPYGLAQSSLFKNVRLKSVTPTFLWFLSFLSPPRRPFEHLCELRDQRSKGS